MAKYDITLKRLTDEFPEDYIRFALGVEKFSVEVLHVEAVDKELPLLLREVDFAARVRVEEEEFVLLMEFQTDWKEDLPERMLGYTWRLFEKYRLPVRPFLILLREGGSPLRVYNRSHVGSGRREDPWGKASRDIPALALDEIG
ncbi:MAG: hypothetical protein AAGB97_05680 [Dehalococcoidia bacterium]